MQARPLLHPKGVPGPQPPSTNPRVPAAQTPDEQISPDAQSPSTEQVHCMPVCVAVQTADGPHWVLDVHVTHAWFTQTWPGLHWLLDVQVVQPPVHSTHA
jgi:hypothetical protein